MKYSTSQMMMSLAAWSLVSLITFFTIITHAPGGFFSKLQHPQDLKNIVINQNQTRKDFKYSGHSVVHDKLLGGLLLDGLDESSCQSRYQFNLYRMTTTTRPPRQRQPSTYLISRLRNYEALQRRCGPNTNAYQKTVDILKSNGPNTSDYYNTDCKYMIWIPFEGLGNRMISLASTFLYALLTNRVLFIGERDTMADLFCEPFPDVSWFLPSDFPIAHQFKKLSKFSPNSLFKLQSKNHSILPTYVYMNMVAYIGPIEQLSFCDQAQKLLHDVPFLILKSNMYFAPSLFTIPSFEQELDNLFPEKETVFHHLGRYLYHPSNSVWRLITRYYDSYLAKADEKLGIQIRVLNAGRNPYPNLNMILSCTMKENQLLPMTNNNTQPQKDPGGKTKTKAVLITSLMPSFYEEIRKMYWQHATTTGENIVVYQPSHDEKQKTGNEMHDRKALAEIYLLSMCDKLVTTGRSTFGYVAQSLGGLRPWIIYADPGKRHLPNHPYPCKKAFSMEPCGLCSALIYKCNNERENETAAAASLLPYSRSCEDRYPDQETMKLFDDNA